MDNQTFYSSAAALSAAGLPLHRELEAVEKIYPVKINSYCLKQINPALGSADPFYRQFLPDMAELEDQDSDFDPLAEAEQMPVPRLIHRFTDRAVLLATFKCAVRCRFCFRKRTWRAGVADDDISDDELKEITRYLQKTPEIREILISGGDPVLLGVERMQKIICELKKAENIEIIRVATRLPVTAPYLFSCEMIDMLAAIDGVWLATHFNHPAELTVESTGLLRKIVASGIPVINQSVLLKGVNDDCKILEKLFRELVKLRVKPHYLFHVDPVRGVRHFATGIECGLEILRHFRKDLSSLATPTFAIDLPEGGGKVALQPEYRDSMGRFPDIHNRHYIEYQEHLPGAKAK